MPKHSEGSRGGWRRGKVVRPEPEKYSVGPQNVRLDGSNYRGARGAGLNDIYRMTEKAIKDGASTIWVSTLISKDSEDVNSFRWISSSGYRDAQEFLGDIQSAAVSGTSPDEFAAQVHNMDYNVRNAIVWSISAD